MTLKQLEIDLNTQIIFKDKYNIDLTFKNKTNTRFLYNKIKHFNINIKNEKNIETKTNDFITYLLKIID